MLTGLQVISQWNPTTKEIYHASVNACLAPLVSVDGKHVITVEGIGNVKRPHPTQERIAKSNGSQCGFCTPGIVMVRQVTGAYLLKRAVERSDDG
jgi:xanthine dehydrogenase/oxidase